MTDFNETHATSFLLTASPNTISHSQRAHLIRHVELVLEAADLLLVLVSNLNLPTLDRNWVRCGVIIHDAGKLLHPNELSERGNNHENAGHPLCLQHGVPEHIARCTISHGQWQMFLNDGANPYPWEISLEELLVATADKLWKGIRKPELETALIQIVADQLQVGYWGLWVKMDQCFEDIANQGDERLQRSRI